MVTPHTNHFHNYNHDDDDDDDDNDINIITNNFYQSLPTYYRP